MTVDAWLKAATEDAERRGLPDLKPLLETLARSTRALRDIDATVALLEHRGESSQDPRP
jgi:hypothetical protein